MDTQKQVIIRGDEAFVQTIQERSAGPIEKILESMLVKDKISFLPMSFPPLADCRFNQQNYLGNYGKDKTYLFAQLSHWPMADSTMMQRKNGSDELTEYFIYTGNRSTTEVHDIMERAGFTPEERNVQEITEGGWKIPEGYSLWMMLEYMNGYMSNPYTFMMDINFTPYIPQFPNVYKDTGRICAGDDFGDFQRDIHILEKFTQSLECLHKAPPNNDLRNTACEFPVMRWDLDGKSIVPSEDKMKHFLDSAISDNRIMQFVTFMKELHG